MLQISSTINLHNGSIEVSSQGRLHFYALSAISTPSNINPTTKASCAALLSKLPETNHSNVSTVDIALNADGSLLHPAIAESSGTICTVHDPSLSKSGIRVAVKIELARVCKSSDIFQGSVWSTSTRQSAGNIPCQAIYAGNTYKSSLRNIETRRLLTERPATQQPRYALIIVVWLTHICFLSSSLTFYLQNNIT